ALVGAIAAEERAHVAVGVTWFARACTALGLQPGEMYRRWLLQLNPDLLKGPFDHCERNLVRLPREWYDPQAWPQQQQEIPPPSIQPSSQLPSSPPPQEQEQQQPQQQATAAAAAVPVADGGSCSGQHAGGVSSAPQCTTRDRVVRPVRG
ncbi:hypothetical protein Agub_g12759, partial [Astrephomene gubernaculifera]